MATGSTMFAVVKALRMRGPARIVVAAPVASPEAGDALSAVADEVVAVLTPRPLGAVGRWYDDFAPTTDDEIRALLA
jgi:predicted phosphoribosyltransferase